MIAAVPDWRMHLCNNEEIIYQGEQGKSILSGLPATKDVFNSVLFRLFFGKRMAPGNPLVCSSASA